MAELPVAKVVRVGVEQAREGGPASATVLPLAPRAIPRRLVWRILFGTPIAKFGWLFAALGMVFNLLFLPGAENPFRSYDRTTSARISGVEETNSSENNARIYRVHFSFVDDAGVEHRGASYTKQPDVVGDARVEYAAADPSRARLVGMRAKRFGWIAMLVLVFPIAGIALAFPQLGAGLRAVRLLRHGVETDGKLVSKKDTSMKLNGEPIVAMTFEYQVGGKTYTTIVKTLSTEKLEDDPREKMLYDPYAPQRATTLDHLPGSPVVTSTGQIEAQPGFAAHVLVMPVVTLTLIIATVIVLAAS